MKVVSWNILAPVWVHPDFYPGVPTALLDAAQRRVRIAHTLAEYNADVLLLQEVQKDEVEHIFTQDTLNNKYTWHFVPNPPEVWATWLTSTTDFKPRANGVLLAWKQGVFADEPVRRDVTLDDVMGVCATALVGKVKEWGGRKVIFAVSHLDVDSTVLADSQAAVMQDALARLRDETGAEQVVWGGDFNVESHSPLLTRLTKKGYTIATDMHGQAGIHSVMSTAGSSRIDHILVSGPSLTCTEAQCPQCPLPYILGRIPLLTTRQWLKQEAMPVYDRHRWMFLVISILLAAAFLSVMTLDWLLILLRSIVVGLGILFYVMRTWSMQSLDRAKWSLETFGSDHLPVQVTLTLQQ